MWKNDITLWDDAVRKSPDNARAHIGMGTAFFRSGFVERSIYHYNRALSLEPESAKALNGLGLVYAKIGFLDIAIHYYEAAVILRPDYADAHFNLGLAYLNPAKRDLIRARKEFEMTLLIAPDHLNARKFLAVISRSNNN